MAKTNEEILEAVRALDPKNDEHWTADGLPRLDAVENLLGGDVNRKAVTNAAPDFTRSVALSLVDADGEPPVDEPPVDGDEDETASEGEAPAEETTSEDDETSAETETADTETVQQSTEASTPSDSETANNDDEDEDDPLAEGPADAEAAMDEEILELQERVDEIRQGLEMGKKMLAEAEEELGAAVDAKNRAFPPMSQAQAIQNFQRNELAKRAAARGVTIHSPLDNALKARKKARTRGAAAGARKLGDNRE